MHRRERLFLVPVFQLDGVPRGGVALDLAGEPLGPRLLGPVVRRIGAVLGQLGRVTLQVVLVRSLHAELAPVRFKHVLGLPPVGAPHVEAADAIRVPILGLPRLEVPHRHIFPVLGDLAVRLETVFNGVLRIDVNGGKGDELENKITQLNLKPFENWLKIPRIHNTQGESLNKIISDLGHGEHHLILDVVRLEHHHVGQRVGDVCRLLLFGGVLNFVGALEDDLSVRAPAGEDTLVRLVVLPGSYDLRRRDCF